MIMKLLVVVTALSLTFAALIGVIRAQPIDADADLRDLLMPPTGCASPCFLGIQPGVTSRREAIALLRAHPWVTSVEAEGPAVIWQWRDDLTVFATANEPMFFSFMDVVSEIHVDTRVPIWRLWLMLGQPDRERIAPSRVMIARGGQRVTALQQARVYAEFGALVSTYIDCSDRPDALWKAQARLVWAFSISGGGPPVSVFHHLHLCGPRS
jgi:hypothetical protein